MMQAQEVAEPAAQTNWLQPTLVALLLLAVVVLILLLHRIRTSVRRSRSESISRAKLITEPVTAAGPHVGDSADYRRSTLTIAAEIAGIVGAVIAIVTLIVR